MVDAITNAETPRKEGTTSSDPTPTMTMQSPTTTVVMSREAPKLVRFQMRGSQRETLVDDWTQLKGMTNAEWNEAIARIAEYEQNGEDFRVDWTLILPHHVRMEAQFQYICDQ